jgi:hypothetical protein
MKLYPYSVIEINAYIVSSFCFPEKNFTMKDMRI